MTEPNWKLLYLHATNDLARLQSKYDYLKTTHPEIHREIEDAYSNH